jgi:uncharacterized protein (TIGR02118 family)
MTVKIVALFAQPADREAFERHYLDVHVPLTEKVPGMDRFESARFAAALDRGEQPFYRIAEMFFVDDDALQAALRSVEMKESGADFRRIAPPGSRLFAATVD